MLDALGEWVAQPYLFAYYGGTPSPRTGARHASISPYGPYSTGDGSTIFLGLQNEREWVDLCRDLLDRPDLIEDERFSNNTNRVANDSALTAIIEQALAPYTTDEVISRLEAAGIANAQLRDMADFASHPQLVARNRWRNVESPAGAVRMLLPPVTVPGREPAMGAIPALGEHTRAIRTEFGFPNG